MTYVFISYDPTNPARIGTIENYEDHAVAKTIVRQGRGRYCTADEIRAAEAANKLVQVPADGDSAEASGEGAVDTSKPSGRGTRSSSGG